MHDLWEDSDEFVASKQQPAGQGRTRLTEAAVQSALRAWLLHDYAAPYCRSLAATRIFRRCYWVDALGGPGGPRASLASALAQVSEVARALADETPPMLLHGLLLASGKAGKRPGKGDKATTHTTQPLNEQASFTLPRGSSIVEMGFPMPALVSTLEQFASIFLCNPFAPLDPSPTKRAVPFMTHDELTPFYARTAPTELCLLISRAQLEGRLLPALRTVGGAAAFTALVRNDRWKTLLAQEPLPGRAGDRQDGLHMDVGDGLVSFLQGAMQPHFLAVQRVAFPMMSGPATVEETPFELLFATRRQDSLMCMNDAVCNYRRRLEEHSVRGLLNETWFGDQQRARLAEARQKLQERILELGFAQTPRRWPDLRQYVLLEHFGTYLVSEYDAILSGLLEAGTIRCEWRPRASGAEQQEKRLPGNDDVLLWRTAKRHH